MRATILSLALALLAVCAHARAGDDPREASRAAFRRGVEELKHGDYANARASFLEAYRLYAHPSILLNLGVARSKTGEWVEAERDLSRFITEDTGASPEEVAAARATLADVRKHVATVRVRVGPSTATATLDGKPVALLPGAFVDVRVVEGAHVVVARADRHQPAERRVEVSPEQTADVDLTLVPSAAPAPVPESGPSARRTFGWALVGISTVAVGVGIWSGLRAQALADEYNTPGTSSFQDPDKRGDGIAHRTGADVAFGIAIASALGGAYLLLDPFGRQATRFGVGPGFAAARASF
jgi:hypothetical protein